MRRGSDARERIGPGGAPAWWRRLTWPAWDLALEPVRAADAGRVARALTEEIARAVGVASRDAMRAKTPVWAAEAEELALEREAYRYLVVRGGRFAGAIETRLDATRGHVGYWLRRSARGRGTATLANHLVLAVAFDGFGLRAVDWTANAENAASIAIFERLGARRIALVATPNERWRTAEVRYRLERAAYRIPPDGPQSLGELLRASDNVNQK